MTKENKFKFYEKKGNSYEPKASEDYFVSSEGDVYYANFADNYLSDVSSDMIAVQSTGLKDKNGKEIYEGDILKHTPAKEANYFVKYLTSGFYLCPNNKDYGEYFNSLFAGYDYKNQCNSIEIIGNIYENPELIGDKND